MQYCTLDDAWGIDKITNNYKKYMNNDINNINNNNDINNINNNNINNNINNINNDINNDMNNNKINKHTIEQFENNYDNNYNNYTNKSIMNNDIFNKSICDNFIIHLHNCKYCQSKMKNYLRPNIIDNLYSVIDNNKDIIVLILIGICILLFFNLIINITK